MPYIVLSPEQSQMLEEASEAVEVRDQRGRVLARIPPASEAAIIVEAKRRLAANGARYSSAEVQTRLRKLAEIGQREELDETKVKDLLRRMRAGEEV